MADTILLSIHDDAPAGAPLLTIPGGIGLYRKTVMLQLSLVVDGGIAADVKFQGCVFRLGSNGDSFLNQLIPGSPDTEDFDIGFHWDQNGITFTGAGLLEITLPIRAQLPFIQLSALHIIAAPQTG